jgi:hypothetical protein
MNIARLKTGRFGGSIPPLPTTNGAKEMTAWARAPCLS